MALELGRHTLRWLDTPHVPHGWECGVMMETATRTLCGDRFPQLGGGATRLRALARRHRPCWQRPQLATQAVHPRPVPRLEDSAFFPHP
jgi:hypothetical protein